jgi:hypothetical protein
MKKLPHNALLIVYLFVLPFFYCKKEVTFIPAATHTHLPKLDIELSSSTVDLYQANANFTALRINWKFEGNECLTVPVNYVLQIDLKNNQFANPIEVKLGSGMAMSYTVKELNDILQNVLEPGDKGEVIVRIKYGVSNASDSRETVGDEIYYSDMMLVKVSTYRNVVEYAYPNFMSLPGNYQSWDPLIAPRIVCDPLKRIYEGYVYFTNEYPQFLMVRGTKWTDITFGHIGDGMFGVKGSMLSIFGGKGVYLVRADANTNRWTYQKISSMGILGSAVPQMGKLDVEMLPDPQNPAIWSATLNLNAGELRFRANNSNDINFGDNWPAGDHIPDYGGDPIKITKAGTYTVMLDLSIPGNYLFRIRSNP